MVKQTLKRSKTWLGVGFDRLACPDPKCTHVGLCITKAHIKLEHGGKTQYEFEKEFGLPYLIPKDMKGFESLMEAKEDM